MQADLVIWELVLVFATAGLLRPARDYDSHIFWKL